MQTSEQINELAKALCKAQGQIETATKDTRNDFFKSRYADLASVWQACRKPLTDNGLSIVQGLSSQDNKVTCTTMLLHESGQYIRTEFSMTPQQNTPQAAGSCATYLRRYSLQAMVSVAPDDDDGNAATMGVSNGSSKNYSTDKKVISSTPTPSPVVSSTHAAVSPIASALKTAGNFDKTNAVHCKYVNQFLISKNQLSLFDVLCKRLEGKPFTQTIVAEEFKVIDPEYFVEPKE